LKNLKLYELFTDTKLDSVEDDNEAMVQRIMTMCDVDGDNHISYEEFVQAAINHSALLNKPNIDQIFDMLDINSDGQIDQQEIRENFKVTNDDDEEIIQQIIAEVDTNNDKCISQEEFELGMKKMLIGCFKNN
jgi:Ca2+-binding EF-hand superfamily protein